MKDIFCDRWSFPYWHPSFCMLGYSHQLNRWIEARGSSVPAPTRQAVGVGKGNIAEVSGLAWARMLVRQRISAGLSQNFCEALSRAVNSLPWGSLICWIMDRLTKRFIFYSPHSGWGNCRYDAKFWIKISELSAYKLCHKRPTTPMGRRPSRRRTR